MIGLGVPLSSVKTPGGFPQAPGVYILRLNGAVMKVGSAKIGVHKRMQQYYGQNPCCGLNGYITLENRDRITVDYQLCEPAFCAELESKLFDKYGSPGALPWAERRPHAATDACALYI